MLQYSTFFRPVFWVVMGLLYALIIAGAGIWAQDLNLSMNWWKWLLASFWYVALSMGIAVGFTFIGEKEPHAGYRIAGLTVVVMALLGVGLWWAI